MSKPDRQNHVSTPQVISPAFQSRTFSVDDAPQLAVTDQTLRRRFVEPVIETISKGPDKGAQRAESTKEHQHAIVNPPAPRILVIGSGPAGLAVSQALRKKGLSIRLVDRFGSAGGAYARMYDRITLASPPEYLNLPGLPFRAGGKYASVKEFKHYLKSYADVLGKIKK